MTAIQDQATTEGTAFPGSRKTYLQGSREDLRVPMREVVLSTGDSVILYDTSGPYTDTALRTDIRLGLSALREGWIAERADTAPYDGRPVQPVDNGLKAHDTRNLDSRFAGTRKPRRAVDWHTVTQLAYARRGLITPEMEFIALREGCTPEHVRDEVGQDVDGRGEQRRRLAGIGLDRAYRRPGAAERRGAAGSGGAGRREWRFASAQRLAHLRSRRNEIATGPNLVTV